jgi:N-acetylneuraminic acid mutarotase
MNVPRSAFKLLVIVILVLSAMPLIFSTFSYFTFIMATSQRSDWVKEKSMPVARSEVAGTDLNGKLYILGGFDSSGESTTGVEVYDPITDNWGTSVPVPKPIDHAAVASYAGKLYVIGGGYQKEALSNKLFIYDPISDNWTEGANLPTARGALTANFINGTLYAIGGIDVSGASNSNQAYDPKTNTWTERASMPTAREHLTSAVVKNKLYVIGGRQADDGSPKLNVDITEMYNPINDSWTVMEQMPTKRSGIAAAASPADNNIYVFGGQSMDGAFNNTEKYDPKMNHWTAEKPMPTARLGLTAAPLDDKIFVIGGKTDVGPHVSELNEILYVGSNGTNS